jgi:anti-sigma-K factor RskA
MIDEAKEHQARLYARGLLSAAERAKFEAALQEDAALREFVARLSEPASDHPELAPDEQLSPFKSRLLAAFERSAPAVETSATPVGRFERGGMPYWLPWVLATSLALICGLLLTQGPPGDPKFAELKQRLDEAEQRNAERKSETETLGRTIDKLKQKDRLSQLQIVLLNSPATAFPKPTAVVVWNRTTRQGLLVGQNPASLSETQVFQLWGAAPDEPVVSAGVFRADDQGQVRFEFALPRGTAARFFVTVERLGGSSQPQGPIALTSD